MTISGQFLTAAGGVSLQLVVEPRAFVNIVLDNTGGNDWTVNLEKMIGAGGAYQVLATYSDDTTGTLWQNDTNQQILVRLHNTVLEDAGDTVDYVLQSASSVAPVVGDAAVVEIVHTGPGKAGTTAGWVVAAGNNLGTLATLPLNITSGTLVVRAPDLRIGDRIVGVYLIGSAQATAAKATVINVDLRKITAITTGGTDASIADLDAPLSVETDTVLGVANTQVGPIDYTVVDGVTHYVLITGTTFNDAGNTVTLHAVVFQVIPS